jgi:hypothetical protein
MDVSDTKKLQKAGTRVSHTKGWQRTAAALTSVIALSTLALPAHAQRVSISGGKAVNGIPQGNSGNTVLEQAGIEVAGGQIWVDGMLDNLGDVTLTLYDVGSESHWKNRIRLGNLAGKPVSDNDNHWRGSTGDFTNGPAPFLRIGSVIQSSGLADFEFWRIEPDPDYQIVVNGQSPMMMVPEYGYASIALAYLSADYRIVDGPTNRILVLLEDGGVDRDYDDYVGILQASPPPAYSVSPTAIGFGRVERNSVSAGKTVNVTNTGTVPLTISSIVLAGDDADHFSRINNCPTTLPPADSCAVKVVFKPTSIGNKAARLRVNAGVSVTRVELSGTGI